jgi:hypothetical protein
MGGVDPWAVRGPNLARRGAPQSGANPGLAAPNDMIRFICQCGQRLKCQDEHAGKSVRCSVCERVQVVPTLGQAIRFREAPDLNGAQSLFLEPDAGRQRDG